MAVRLITDATAWCVLASRGMSNREIQLIPVQEDGWVGVKRCPCYQLIHCAAGARNERRSVNGLGSMTPPSDQRCSRDPTPALQPHTGCKPKDKTSRTLVQKEEEQHWKVTAKIVLRHANYLRCSTVLRVKVKEVKQYVTGEVVRQYVTQKNCTHTTTSGLPSYKLKSFEIMTKLF